MHVFKLIYFQIAFYDSFQTVSRKLFCIKYFFFCSHFTESPTSERSFVSNDEISQCDDSKKSLAKKSLPSERPPEGNKSPLKTQSLTKKPSLANSRSSSPLNKDIQAPVRRYSAVNESDSYRRKSNKENEIRKGPRSRSATPGRHNSVEVPLHPQHSKMALSSENKFGTWNGKSKKRSGLHPDIYASSNFVRNGLGRNSVGSCSSAYSPAIGRRAHRNMSPLLADLLKTKNLDDDKTILIKMREIINQYSGIFEDSPEKKYDCGAGADELDFTSEWVRNNGSLRKMESGDYDEKMSPNKRKDSKYDGTHSKIPAPIFFKQHVSEKEC